MKFFSHLYVRFLTWVATVLAKALGGTMRRLCLAQGKDPDYQAPPVAAPQEIGDPIPTAEQIEQKLHKFFSTSSPRTTVTWEGAWIKDSSQHPILKHRAQFEGKSHLKLVDSEPQPPELTPTEAEQILQVSSSSPEWEEQLKLVVGEKK